MNGSSSDKHIHSLMFTNLLFSAVQHYATTRSYRYQYDRTDFNPIRQYFIRIQYLKFIAYESQSDRTNNTLCYMILYNREYEFQTRARDILIEFMSRGILVLDIYGNTAPLSFVPMHFWLIMDFKTSNKSILSHVIS